MNPASSRIPPRVPVEGNPGFRYHDAIIIEDTVWRGEVLITGTLTVAPQATLTIESGTVVRIKRTGNDGGLSGVLLILGRVVASGTPTAPIVFTSSFSDLKAGDWQGIVLLASEKKNLLEQCRVEGAQVGIDASFSTLTLKQVILADNGIGLRCADCLLQMVAGVLRNSLEGMKLDDSEVDVRAVQMVNNQKGIVARRTSLAIIGSSILKNTYHAVTADNCRLEIASSNFSDNGGGLRLNDCEGRVTGSTIRKNAGHGIHVRSSRLRISGNAVEQNGGNGLHLEDGISAVWGNSFAANSGYDCFNAGKDEVRVIANWWGSVSSAEVALRMGGMSDGKESGRILFLPLLLARPPVAP